MAKGSTYYFLNEPVIYLAERMVIGRRNAGPETTFRIVAYSTVPELLAWVAFVGGLIGLYGVFLTVVGLREVHQTTTSKAVKGFVATLALSVAAAIVVGVVVAIFVVVLA